MHKSTTAQRTENNPTDLTENIGHASWKHRLGLVTLFAMTYLIFYVYPNFNPPVEPRELPLLWIDRAMPFLPWTFTVYLSEFLLMAVSVILIKNKERFNSFARLAFYVLGIIGPVFYFFPTLYQRPVYPTEENIVIDFAMNLIKSADAPTNCFPSLHVATTLVAVYSLRFLKPKIWFIFILWGLAIFASTLTTKQHYLIDILGGVAVTSVVIVVDRFHRIEKDMKARNLGNTNGFWRR